MDLGKMALQIICEAVKTTALRSARQQHRLDSSSLESIKAVETAIVTGRASSLFNGQSHSPRHSSDPGPRDGSARGRGVFVIGQRGSDQAAEAPSLTPRTG